MINNLSVIIHTYNSEKEIVDCIESAKDLSDKIIIIDMKSTDKTLKLAEKFTKAIYQIEYQKYVEPAREYGINQAKTDWVFILDTDERITKELAQEIKEKIKNSQFGYYKIPRKNIFINQWLKNGGWWPDYQIRLINKKFFVSWPKEIHSTPIIKGSFDYLKNPLLHYFHGDLESMVKKTAIFEDIEADLLFKAQKKANTPTFFRKFLGEFWRRFFKNLGFLDGNIGIIECIYQAFSKTITYLFLYEKYLFKKQQSKEKN